jgi:hypothetical protein
MKSWRSRGWLAALVLGYALLYIVHYAETAYSLPRSLNPDALGMVRELFLKSLAFAPLAWFAEGPCQRLPHLNVAVLMVAATLLVSGYLGALRSVARGPAEWSLPRILGWSALAALPLLTLLPPASIDYAAYILNGRVASVYHLNPWRDPIQQFPAEQSYVAPFIWGPGLCCIYGPVFVVVMTVLTFISHLLAPGNMAPGSFVLNMLLLRAVNIAFFVAAAVAVWRINGRLWPRQQRLVTTAFLFNPLLVYEGIASLHNDLWGMVFLLWACVLFLEDDTRFLVPLALSILTKYIAIAAAPFMAVYYVRRRDWPRLGWMAVTVLVSLALVKVTAGDYLAATLAAKSTRGLCMGSGPIWTACLIDFFHKAPNLNDLCSQMSTLLTRLFVPIYVALVWQTRTRQQALLNCAWALSLYFVAAHLQLMPWYLLWPLGMLFMVRWTRATANLVWAAGLAVFSYASYFWHHHNSGHGISIPIQLAAFATIAVLPVLLYQAGRRRWWSVCTPPEESLDEERGGGRRISRSKTDRAGSRELQRVTR